MQHLLVERTPSIDVGELNRWGAFSGHPMRFPFLSLTTRRFKIEYRESNWPTHRRSQIIPVVWTRCHFGGMRPWFICPCEKRVAKLYPGVLGFYCCRKCGNVTYRSQQQGRKSRLYRKAQEIRRLLQDEGRPGVSALPERPRGMHRKTFGRLLVSLEDIERELIGGNGFRPRPRRGRTQCWR